MGTTHIKNSHPPIFIENALNHVTINQGCYLYHVNTFFSICLVKVMMPTLWHNASWGQLWSIVTTQTNWMSPKELHVFQQLSEGIQFSGRQSQQSLRWCVWKSTRRQRHHKSAYDGQRTLHKMDFEVESRCFRNCDYKAFENHSAYRGSSDILQSYLKT